MIVLNIVVIIIMIILIYQLNRKVDRIMTAEEKLAEYVQEIDAETTRIADLIANLISQVQEGTLTFDELVAGLQPSIDALKLVGATPPQP